LPHAENVLTTTLIFVVSSSGLWR